MLVNEKLGRGYCYCHALVLSRVSRETRACRFVQGRLIWNGRHWFCTPHYREAQREASRDRDDRRGRRGR